MTLSPAPTPPPPISSAPQSAKKPAPEIPWRLWLALLLFIPLSDYLIFPFEENAAGLGGAGLAAWFFAIAAFALFVSRSRGRLALGAAILLTALPVTVWQPGWANLISFAGGLAVLAWNPRSSELAWGTLHSFLRVLTAPFFLPVYFAQTGAALLQKRFPRAHRFWHWVGIALPGVLLSGFFLLFLCWGNAVLAQWISSAAKEFALLLQSLVFPDFLRVVFWGGLLVLGVFLFVPAHRCQEPISPGKLFAARRTASRDAAAAHWRWVFALAGVNLVFLLTNTLDVVYLWIRRQPPVNVGTTDYLYNGVYGLIFATILAGGVLALVFNGATSLTRSRWLRGLGFLWVAQNVFLILGVAFRLWLHIDRFCLTPRRVEVAFFLLLVLAGFVLLLFHILREKSLRWLISGNLLAVFVLFWGIQFADVDKWCVDSAMKKRRADPALRIDDDFLRDLDGSRWRLVHMLAQMDGDAPDIVAARKTWAQAKENICRTIINEWPTPSDHWKSYTGRAARESRALCEVLGIPPRDDLYIWCCTEPPANPVKRDDAHR